VVNYRQHVEDIATADAAVVVEKDKQYGASWCKRGGVGAYMVMIRKVDRMEEACQKRGYNIFEAVARDNRSEGLIDDIRDLRQYLLLIEAYLVETGAVGIQGSKQNEEKLVEDVCGFEFDSSGLRCYLAPRHTGDHLARLPEPHKDPHYNRDSWHEGETDGRI
jgi:hypothetical protein